MAEDQLNFDADVTLWAQIAATRMVKALKRYKIGKSGALMQSIQQEIYKNGGDSYKAIFRYLQYGRFVDIGTGRGFTRGARGTASFALSRNENGTLKAAVNRHPKSWYSKTMYREIKILSEKLLADMDEKVMETIKARIRRINSHTSNPS